MLVCCFWVFVVLFFSPVFAQPSVSPWHPIGRLDHAPIRESSGFVTSRQFDDVYWTLNDSGNPNAPRYAVAYALTYAYSKNARLADLLVGSDDQVAVWVNGKEVHRNNVNRGAYPDSDIVSCELNAGWNEVLCKIGQGGGGWGLFLRFNDPDGSLEYGLTPKE